MPSKAGRCPEESTAAAGSRGIEHRRSGRGGICVHDGEIDAGPSGLSPLLGAADGHCEKEEAVGSPELTFAKTARIDRIREKALSRADSAGRQFKRISAVGLDPGNALADAVGGGGARSDAVRWGVSARGLST